MARSWKERARRAAGRRRERYGFEPPPRVAALLADDAPPTGVAGTLLLVLYTVFGSPRRLLDLAWRLIADRDTPRRRGRIDSLAAELRGRLSPGGRVLTGYFERRLYSRDLARVPRLLEKALHRTTPMIVVQPAAEGDVVEAVRLAARERLPVFPRGVSSSAFGGAVPTTNGVVIDLSPMARVLDVDPGRLTVRVQAGVRWALLAERLRPLGLQPLATPSSRFSTVGGWAATGGIGVESFAHGRFAEAIRSLRVVLADGRAVELGRGDPETADFIGTEGQLGIVTELVLRVRRAAAASLPVLLCFPSVDEALGFTDRMTALGVRPSHVALLDRARLREENLSFRDRTGRGDAIVEEKDAVLLHFDDPAEREKLSRALDGGGGGVTEGDGAAARWLWTERFFPLKLQRLGPGLLAAELVMDRGAAAGFVRKARALAARFGAEAAVEAFVSRPDAGTGAGDCVVIASFRCDPGRRLGYLLRLLLVQLIVHAGVRAGGRPYGYGIWNSPFLRRSLPREERRRLVRRKLQLDPRLLLNPMKFFRLRTRLFNIPGLFFASPMFGIGMGLVRLFSPLLGLLARSLDPVPAAAAWSPPPAAAAGAQGARLLRESSQRCTFCGACVAACPAYLLTGDERATGRGKLRLGETLLSGGRVRPEEAAASFQCLRCGLCAEVCQTRLPLVDCYEELEAIVERAQGRPDELIRGFTKKADESHDWVGRTFGLRAPRRAAAACAHPLGREQDGARGGAS